MSGEDSTQSSTTLADLMAELIAPPDPEPVSLVPQTLGWPISLVLLLTLATFVFRKVVRKRRAEAYRHAALIALDAAGTTPSKVALVLRQTALIAFPRAKIASLHGADWLDFLVSTGGQPELQGPDGHPLITLPYSDTSLLPEATVEMVRDWIRHHDRAAPP